MRRSNGSGTVYKLSGKRRKPWIAIVCDGWDGNKQIRRIIGYYATKTEGEIALSLDIVMPSSIYRSITLKGLWEMWKTTEAYTELSRQTHDSYNAAYNYMSKFQNTKFEDLRTPHFQKMVNNAKLQGKSRSTMNKIKTLSSILSEYAYSQDVVNKTYYHGVRIPAVEKKEIPTFTDLEIKKLFDNDALPLVDTILILIYTGMRISELLTLSRFHVDIKNMLITGGVKTEAGKDRVIPIHPKIQKYIVARFNESENYLIEYDKTSGNKKRGNINTERRPYLVQYYRDLYYETLDKLGLRRLTPHKARHTFFTMLSAKCKDRKAMALVGGHTDPNFTDKTYVQPDIDRLRRAIECL